MLKVIQIFIYYLQSLEEFKYLTYQSVTSIVTLMCFKFLQSQESSLGKMPGGQEPKEKKRKRPDRREKEKPLLAVQVLLELDGAI